jgi:copper(I)-binding protein
MRSEKKRSLLMRALAARLAVTALVVGASAGVAAPDTSSLTPPAVPPSAVATPQVTEAWIRWLPGDLPAAAYLTVTNPGATPAALLGASSADYADVSLHRNEMNAGSMQMVGLDRLVIPAHTTLRFELSGYHLMLMQAARPIKPGDRVTITLRFADLPPLPVVFEVRKPDGSRAG